MGQNADTDKVGITSAKMLGLAPANFQVAPHNALDTIEPENNAFVQRSTLQVVFHRERHVYASV